MSNQYRDYVHLCLERSRQWRRKERHLLAAKAAGTFGHPSYDDINNKRATLLIGRNPNVGPPPGKGAALVEPQGYSRMWIDQKSGGDHNGSMWRPIAPPGYVSLSDVTVKGWSSPPNNLVWCIRSDLVVQGLYEGSSVWDDKKSGSKNDVSCWRIVPDTNGITGNENIAVQTDGFRASQNYEKPHAPFARMFALKLPKNFKDFTAPTPRLDRDNLPKQGTIFNETEQAAVILPFVSHFPPTDERCLANISKPFCRFSRTIAWYTNGVWSNNARGEVTRRSVVTFGISKTQSTEITHSAGISVSASAGIGFVNFDVSLNYQFTHSSSTSFTEYTEKVEAEDFVVPAYHATVLFTKRVWLRAARMDGTIVMVSISLDSYDEKYYVGVDYPKPPGEATALEEAEALETPQTEEPKVEE
ncbi:hypothetical protein PT974_05377 [Cladobotryum mycophilum]|uniref:Insecticidal crystal toxin domain-containing protein n=1 Tax=Cladobotryum mycophilum TaxID=491253 RepID=A0ABR0SJG7_9HYPO